MLGRLPAKPDNPFWQLTIRRIRRLGDGQVFWPPILLALGFALLAPLPPDRFEAWPGRFTRWNLLVAGQALVVALAAGAPGWRLLTDQLHEANAVALRLSRLLPLRAVGGLAVWPLLSGLRTAALTAPLVVALSLMPGPPGPPLAGLLGVYALVAVYATWLAAAGGAALTRTRHASIDNWSDFIFNVRTLSAAFLNPAWVLVLVLLLSRRGPALADALVGISPWFHGHLPPALVALPLLLWSIRQAAGLATEIYGETRRLAACAVFSWSAAYVLAVVLVVGFGWQSRFELHGLAVWWELPASPAASAQLLLALLLLAAVPLPLMAAYAEGLRTGLRAGTADGDEPWPRAWLALPALLGAALAAAAVPLLAYALCLRLGGWPVGVAGPAYLARVGWLWGGAVAALTGYLLVLMLSPRFGRRSREPLALAVVLPPLLGPFLLQSSHPWATAVTAISPVTALLWLLPDAGTGVGMTGEISLKLPWRAVAAAQWGAALALLVVGAWILGHPPRSAGAASTRGRSWSASLCNPLLSLDLLVLQRRGWLLSPLVMVLLPALAMAYIRLHEALDRMVVDACTLFIWPGSVVEAGDEAGKIIPIVLGTIGAQLLLHPAGLAGVRSFARDQAAGRMAGLWLTPLSTRELVVGRYLGVVAPFAIFLAITGPLLLLLAQVVEQTTLAVGGLAHWLALVLLVPAAVLAGTSSQDWKGQGAAGLLGLEAARLTASATVLSPLGVPVGPLVANLGFLLLALPLTLWALRLAERRLDGQRAGDS